MKKSSYKLILNVEQKIILESVLIMRVKDLEETISTLEEYCPDWLFEEKEKTANLLKHIQDLPF